MQKPKFNIGAAINSELYERIMAYSKKTGNTIASIVKEGVIYVLEKNENSGKNKK